MKTKRPFEFVGTAKEKIFTPIREILSAFRYNRNTVLFVVLQTVDFSTGAKRYSFAFLRV